MYEDPKSFPVEITAKWPADESGRTEAVRAPILLNTLQLAAAFALIEAALWTPVGVLNTILIILAVLCILVAIGRSGQSAKALGAAVPGPQSVGWILGWTAVLCVFIPLIPLVTGLYLGTAHVAPFGEACVYAAWALAQQFILQSFFYLRLETLLGGRRAVWVSALLFGAVHIPNPILTVGAFLGGLFFCEMFRRYRNLPLLGVAHAALGLTVAASFSDSVLHHMRVGEAYLRFHP